MTESQKEQMKKLAEEYFDVSIGTTFLLEDIYKAGFQAAMSIAEENGIVNYRQGYQDANIDKSKLQNQLADAVEALRFYADKETYDCKYKSQATGNKVFDIVCFDFDRNLDPKMDYAGKRARECLARLGQKI